MRESTDLLTRITNELERAGNPLGIQELADRIGTTYNSVLTTISKARNNPSSAPLIERLKKVERGVTTLEEVVKESAG